MDGLVEKYRIIGYTGNGTVVTTIRCDEDEIEKTHDEVAQLHGVTLVLTLGPFSYREGSSWL